MKILSNNTIAQLSATSFLYAELIEFQLGTPLYLSTASYDITTSTSTSQGNQTYLAQGKFLNYSGVRQGDELRINNVAIALSGSTDTFVNILLQDQYLHRKMQIYRAWIDVATNALVATPSLVYAGTITGGDITDTEKECTVSFTTSNEFYDFDKIAGRKTNMGSQQRFFPTDEGMIFSTSAIADINWGKTNTA
jgi:hypothetical protein